MHIGLISAAFPPDLDGIGDYTWWMAKTLVELGHRVTVFTRIGEVRTLPAAATIVPFYDPARPESFGELEGALEQMPEESRPEWVVLQYNPFSWGHRGFCPAVGRTLARVRRRAGSPRVAVMFHETMVPRWPWKFAVMYAWQSYFFGQVCRAAERIFVSTERWLPQVAATRTRAEASLLPVGSNIPVSSLSREEARAKLGLSNDTLIAGIFGGAHGSRRIDWIAAAMKRYLSEPGARDLLLLHVGPDAEVIARALEGIPLRSLGVLPGEEVADALRAMDCLMSPFVDGMSCRRTSAIAPLLNGIPVATTGREWTDGVFRKADPQALLLTPASNGEGFARDSVAWMRRLERETGDAARTLANREFSWTRIAERMIRESASAKPKNHLG